MSDNFLKFTGLTHSELYTQIKDKLNADTRFDNPRESAIFQTLIEIFAGSTDITNYYIQRRAEECYFDTAQLKSSIILLARQLGYVVTRPTPARTRLKIIISGDMTGIFDTSPGADNKIQMPFFSKFTFDGNDYVLVDTFTYNITDTVLNDMIAQGSDFELEVVQDSFENDIVVVQGEVKERVIVGKTNNQVGANFQIYKIEDTEFSDSYGDKDFFFNDVTRVYVGNRKDDSTRFDIDRRSLVNWESLESNDQSTASDICLVRTTPDENIEVIFGDDKFASKGALTQEDNVYVQYLATKGASANTVGVVGKNVNFSGNVFTNTGVEVTDKITFELYANVTGGSDIEDNDSIKFSAPRIYYSLDRLVSKSDYINHLKSLKTPIDVQNAIAWGEQEERDKAGIFADIKMFNVTLFTVVGSLYDTDSEIYKPKTQHMGLDEAVLDINYDPQGIPIQSYFNVYTRQAIALQLKEYVSTIFNQAIFGKPLETGFTPSYFVNAYGSNGVLSFTYFSDVVANASNINAEGQAIADFTGLGPNATMDDIADKVNDALAGFMDVRANTFDNANYNMAAFSNGLDPLVTWNSTDETFEIRFEPNSPNTIALMFGNLSSDLGFLSTTPKTLSTVDTREISGEINQVVQDLDTRAQMNIKNIYVSPIIHNFNLEGTVYIKSLYDKEALRTEINNSVYSFLDLNADFNVPLRASNITEVIEKHPGIVNVNSKLIPEDITAGINNITNEFYVGWDGGVIKQYGEDLSILFGTSLAEYLTPITDGFIPIDETRYFYNDFAFKFLGTVLTAELQHELEHLQFRLLNHVNERSFLNDFLSKLYDVLFQKAQDQNPPNDPNDANDRNYLDANGDTVVNYRRFLGYAETATSFNSLNEFMALDVNSDFIKEITKIHKDLSYLIKVNLLDSFGNVEEEFDNNNKYVRGGYSLGSEIIKVSLEKLDYVYK
jgi:hypothetical protein